jgi:hypothetical protein
MLTLPAGQFKMQILLSRLRLPTHEVQLMAKLAHVAQLLSHSVATPPLL